MRRGWVALALLVSLGVNLGLLAAVAAGRWVERGEAAEPGPVAALPDGGRELPEPTSVVLPRDEAGTVPAGGGEPGERQRFGRHRGGGPFAGRAGEPPVGRLADHLGLTGERRERFVALQRRFVSVQIEARSERRRLSSELRAELLEAQPDAERIDRILARLGEVYLASERATVEVILESRGLLDSEQQRVYFGFLEHLRGPGTPRGAPRPGPPAERSR